MIDAWRQVIVHDAPPATQTNWSAVLSAYSAEEELAVCNKRQKRFYEGILARVRTDYRMSTRRPCSACHSDTSQSPKNEPDRRRRQANAAQLAQLTQFCRLREEPICRNLLLLEFGAQLHSHTQHTHIHTHTTTHYTHNIHHPHTTQTQHTRIAVTVYSINRG